MANTTRYLSLMAIGLITLLSTQSAEAAPTTIKSKDGAIFTISKATQLQSGEYITVTGRKFDETIGIYVAFCKIVKPNVLPSPCGGGVDQTGSTGASVWISSNPPSYGVGLAKPFLPGGRFSVKLRISPKIGSIDCRKTLCAIYVRADHTRAEDRSHDFYVPVKFKN